MSVEPGMPTSPTYDFVVNPAVVDPTYAASLNASDLHRAQRAFNILQRPYVMHRRTSMSAEAVEAPVGLDVIRDDVKFYHDEGLWAVQSGFKTLRRLAGEAEYGGLEPVSISSFKQVDPVNYCLAASDGELVVTDFDKDHDARVHLTGSLLAIAPVTRITRAAGFAGLHLTADNQENVITRLDYTTLDIRLLWLAQPIEDERIDQVTILTEDLVCLRDAGRTALRQDNLERRGNGQKVSNLQAVADLDDQDILEIANQQDTQMRQWAGKPLFVDPTTLETQAA